MEGKQERQGWSTGGLEKDPRGAETFGKKEGAIGVGLLGKNHPKKSNKERWVRNPSVG